MRSISSVNPVQTVSFSVQSATFQVIPADLITSNDSGVPDGKVRNRTA